MVTKALFTPRADFILLPMFFSSGLSLMRLEGSLNRGGHGLLCLFVYCYLVWESKLPNILLMEQLSSGRMCWLIPRVCLWVRWSLLSVHQLRTDMVFQHLPGSHRLA
jgi:hypothetical protein